MLLDSSMTTLLKIKKIPQIREVLITKGKLTLIPKEALDEHLNDLSRKRQDCWIGWISILNWTPDGQNTAPPPFTLEKP